MTLTPLLDVLTADAGVSRALAVARSGVANADITVAAGARPALIAALARESGRPLLAITATTREAEDLASALGCFLEPDRIADFPAWETLPHERLSPRSDTVGKRLAVSPQNSTRSGLRGQTRRAGLGPRLKSQPPWASPRCRSTKRSPRKRYQAVGWAPVGWCRWMLWTSGCTSLGSVRLRCLPSTR